MYIGFHFAEFPSFGELEKGFDLLNEGEYYYRKVLLNVQKTSYEVYFEIYAFLLVCFVVIKVTILVMCGIISATFSLKKGLIFNGTCN